MTARTHRGHLLAAPVLPLLVATFPVVHLWSSNLHNQVSRADVLLSLSVVLIVTLAVYLVALAALRQPDRASLVTAAIGVGVLSFGYVARAAPVHPETIAATMLLLAYAMLIGAAIVIVRKAEIPRALVPNLAVVAMGLVLLNVARIAFSGTPVSAAGLPNAGDAISIDPTSVGAASGRDVYYLIFDRYANEQTLRELYGFDNTPFLDGLSRKGFTVVHDAVANYPGTAHSLASSLNMTYLDDLASDVGVVSDDWRPLLDSLTGSVAQRTFEDLGYRTVHIGSWWGPTFSDPDADTSYVYRHLREFPTALLYTTALPWAADELGFDVIPEERRDAYARFAFQADALLKVARDPTSTFTFAHFTLPHTPYVADAQGNFVPSDDDRPVEEAYLEQLQYTNTLIGDVTDALLAGSSDQDPIVVLQSDEGPHPVASDADPDPMFDWSEMSRSELERKMRILSAYYFPGSDRPGTRSTVDLQLTRTPVNTFRVILDRYFGADMPLLPDRSFIYVTHDQPYRFEDVSDRLGIGG
jgi:hypothetical protein